MSTLYLSQPNQTRLKLSCEPWMLQTVSDALTFEVPGARHMPAFKAKVWDGKIRLVDQRNGTVPAGLLPRILNLAHHEGWSLKVDQSVWVPHPHKVDDETIARFLEEIRLPKKFSEQFDGAYAYQLAALKRAIQYGRSLILSPTGTGKSLIIYLIIKYFQWAGLSEKALIVCITTSLVRQLAKDFVEYGCDPDDIHEIFEGRSKQFDAPICITTWQSMQHTDARWAAQFDLLIGDEAHTYKSKTTNELISRTVNSKYRFGLTGTLDGTETHLWVLEGAFGPVYRATTTKKAMESGVLAPLHININTIVHPQDTRKKYATYDAEKEYLAKHEGRMRLICDYVSKLETGNVLMLFKTKNKGAKRYFEHLQQIVGDKRDVYYVTGDVDVEERELIREAIERADNAIVVATYKVFSTGINIKRLNHLVPVEGIKASITLLQSIGRILRKDGRQALVHDLIDDMRVGDHQNFAYRHGLERLDIYDEQGFTYEFHTLKLC